MKLLFLDTETTGLDHIKNGIVQIAGVIDIDGERKTSFNLLCRPFPEDQITQQALSIIGKTEDEIKAYPDPKETYKHIIMILDNYVDRYDRADKFYMVGQNVKFDYDFMNQWFIKNGNKYFYGYVNYHLVDLIGIATLFRVAGKLDVPNMKLATLAESFNLELDAHDAKNDILMTRKIFHEFVNQVKGGV